MLVLLDRLRLESLRRHYIIDKHPIFFAKKKTAGWVCIKLFQIDSNRYKTINIPSSFYTVLPDDYISKIDLRKLLRRE